MAHMWTFGLTDCISRGPLTRQMLNCTSIIELHCKTDWLTLQYKVVADHPWRQWLPQDSLKGNWPRISYPVDLKQEYLLHKHWQPEYFILQILNTVWESPAVVMKRAIMLTMPFEVRL